jgi:hypothetical protein
VKKAIKVLILLVVLIAVGGGAVLLITSQGGSSGIENWVGRQVVGVVSRYIEPEFTFETLDYQAPGTVTLTGASLTATDGTEVAKIGTLTLALAEPPRPGAPIQIARIELTDATVQIVETADGFAGFDPFVTSSEEQAAAETTEQPKLSDVLRLRRISLRSGTIRYMTQDGGEPLEWRDLAFDLTSDPIEEDGNVWHTIEFGIDESPLFSLELAGRVDLDRQIASVSELLFKVQLDAESYRALPPQVQSYAREHEATGALTVTAKGDVPLADWMTGSSAAAQIGIEEGRFSFGEYTIPVDSLQSSVWLGGGSVTVPDLKVVMLEGTITAEAQLELSDDAMPLQAQWSLEGLEIQETLRQFQTAQEGEEPPQPRYAGKLSGQGDVTISVAEGLPSIGGAGELHLTEGYLVNAAIVRGLSDAMDLVTGGAEAGHDTADAVFELQSDHVLLSTYEFVSAVVAARGDGRIYYDGRVDMLMNAGPLEKVQKSLGVVGDVFGKLTDSLVKYDVEGEYGALEVKVRPLGIGSGSGD